MKTETCFNGDADLLLAGKYSSQRSGPSPGSGDPSRPRRGLSVSGLVVRQLRLKGAWTASLGLGLTVAFGVAAVCVVLGLWYGTLTLFGQAG